MYGRRTVTSSHYDPWAHARELGLRVLWGDPGDGLLGLYDHDTRIIVLREGMSQMQSRCVLAHEIVHAEHGDMPLKDADPIWCAQREQRCEEKQGTDLFAVDASDAMGLIDGFLVVSAHNERLVNAVADGIEDALREQAGMKPVRREGRASGRWILLDFGDIVIHVQHEEDREFYALDRLWSQAPRIELGVKTETPFDIAGETEEDAARIIPADS
nr:MAG TPA: Ribosomal silencing factor during starvation [Caudoviricetes sp.]